MKKLILILTAFLIFSGPAFADTVIGKSDYIFNTNTVPGTGNTILSRSFNISSVRNMGYWLNLAATASSSGYTGSNVALYMMASPDDVAANYATVTTLTRATNGAATTGTLTFPCMKFIKFRATGIAGQATDSTITAVLFTQG